MPQDLLFANPAMVAERLCEFPGLNQASLPVIPEALDVNAVAQWKSPLTNNENRALGRFRERHQESITAIDEAVATGI